MKCNVFYLKAIILLCFLLLLSNLIGCTDKQTSIQPINESQHVEKEPIHISTNEKEQEKEIEKISSMIEELAFEDTHGRAVDVTEHEEKKAPFIDVKPKVLRNIKHALYKDKTQLSSWESNEYFPEVYSEVEGILTFRGNHSRSAPSYGTLLQRPKTIQVAWQFSTGYDIEWGGGAGWTGQPSIIRWGEDVRRMMNLNDEMKGKENFTEVVYGSLDGKVYFLDIESGKRSREPISLGAPIKGGVALDPRGYPLLFVGQGIQRNDMFGYHIYSLLDSTKLLYIPGRDSRAFRSWGAFDSSAIINRNTDTLIVGGENGLLYNIKLNTSYDIDSMDISIQPETLVYQYRIDGNPYYGIENSVAVYKNLAFFADNGGSIQAINLMNMSPIWALPMLDDTDASIIVEEEDGIPYLYTGTEVDKVNRNGDAHIRKINGLTGEIVWERAYPAYFYQNVNGGVIATPVMGKKAIDDRVIFTIARVNKVNQGVMLALSKETGEEIWSWNMPHYAWSSPVDVYDAEGNAYLVQCDSVGNMYLLDALTGEQIDKVNLGANVEASPAVFYDTIVVATRGGKMIGVSIR